MQNPQRLPQKIITVWLLDKIFEIIIAIIIGIILWYCSHTFWPISTPYVVALFSIVILFDLINLALIPYFYRFWLYEITDDYVFIQSGFFLRKEHTIPINRIQNVDLEQGPILQLTKLKKLKVITAANNYSIDGISFSQAETLRQQIVTAARKARELND